MEYAVIASLLLPLIGRAISMGDEAEARRIKEEAVKQYGPEILPHLEKAVAEQQGATEFGGIQEDPALRGYGLKALRELENVYESEGMTAADKAALQLAQNAASGRALSGYQQVSQALQQRGQTLNPALQAALYSQVGGQAAQVTGQMGLEAQVAARQRALQALEGMGGLSRGIRSDDYRLAGDKARAQDAINAFNARLRTDANQYNLGLPQQGFENEMALRNARANAMQGVAADYQRSAAQTNATFGGLGNAALSYGMKDDDWKKKR